MAYGNSKIYLDHAATTPLRPEVLEEMRPYLTTRYGNPSAAYELGEMSEMAIQRAREQIAQTIHASPEEIYFTSGGSESDNWALKGAVDYAIFHSRTPSKVHMITSAIEHHAILKTASYLMHKGVYMSMLYPDSNGIINVHDMIRKIRKETVMVSVMYANNEIGSIEPISQLGAEASARNVLFHTDAVQAFCQLPINVQEEHIDLLSASGHKIGGPKGIGFLYISKEKKMEPFIHGGGQESGLRAGTENVAAIVGLGAAAKLAYQRMEKRTRHLLKLRNYLAQYIISSLPKCSINGVSSDIFAKEDNTSQLTRLPGNLNITIKGLSGAELVARLDQLGICISTASACSKHSKSQSHVLRAIGLSEEAAGATIRLTLGEENTPAQIHYAANQIVRIAKEIRSL